MKKTLILVCSLLLSNIILAQDSISQKLDDLLSAYAKLSKFNGSVLIGKHGTILLQKGYGIKNAADKSINDANTKFQIASVTKQFTAAVILKLVQLFLIN